MLKRGGLEDVNSDNLDEFTDGQLTGCYWGNLRIFLGSPSEVLETYCWEDGGPVSDTGLTRGHVCPERLLDELDNFFQLVILHKIYTF